jgi:hypothetical protein
MGLLRLAARVAAHNYKFRWAGPSDVIPWIRGYFENTHNIWMALKEVGKDEYEAEIEDGLILTVKGKNADKESIAKGETQLFVNGDPVESLPEAAELIKELKKEHGVEAMIAPYRGNANGFDYELKKYNYDHNRNYEELHVLITDRSGNKIEIDTTSQGAGNTKFNKLLMNGTDVTQAANDMNWAEVGKYYKPKAGEAFDIEKDIYVPVTEAVEDSAAENAKGMGRWTSGPGTFFDWIRSQGYSIIDGKVTPKKSQKIAPAES